MGSTTTSDGKIDYGKDPDCLSLTDGDERGPSAIVFECADGIDNDGDGYIDYPGDKGCGSPSDDERGERRSAPTASTTTATARPTIPTIRAAARPRTRSIPSPPARTASTTTSTARSTSLPIRDASIERGTAEGSLSAKPECNDGFDNDGDGKID